MPSSNWVSRLSSTSAVAEASLFGWSCRLLFLLGLGLVLFGVPLFVGLGDIVPVRIEVIVDAILVLLKDGGFLVGAAAVDGFIARHGQFLLDLYFVGFAQA